MADEPLGAAAGASEPALVASLPEPVPVSAHSGDGQAQGLLPSLVAELSELLAKASPQPWAFKPQEHDDWGMIRTTVSNEDGWFPVVARACDVIYHTSDDYSEHRRNKTDPTEGNAALIVAAVNALPALLDALTPKEAELVKPDCRYCGGAGRFQIVSSVSDHAWADCFCVRTPAVGGIPAGMVAWAGGNRAPEDWEPSGPVKFRGGDVSTSHVDTDCTWFWGHQSQDSDIIAYTPKAPTASHDAARERIARIIDPLVFKEFADALLIAAGMYSDVELAFWMTAPQPLLGMYTPIQLFARGDADKLLCVLKQLEDGVYL